MWLRAGAIEAAVAGAGAAAGLTVSAILAAAGAVVADPVLRAKVAAGAVFAGADFAEVEAGAAAGFAFSARGALEPGAGVLSTLAGVIFSSAFTAAVAAVFAAVLIVFAPALARSSGLLATAPRTLDAALRAVTCAPLFPFVFIVAFAAVVTGASTLVFASVLALFAADLLVFTPSEFSAALVGALLGRAALPLFDVNP
ncbi:hypothetical protein OGR47_10575 [Methylocystis sp. MJC1]|uniref:hypothetical protein n=1 Tax=Methylocystis sp. MJC1 TaxID=2654282 RepID=UPI0013ECE151|nr:hypothetical protein [Methylocystis sp. MJC1]MBU6527428.1 hypothetical protein [Methylocystis sp. MJC1]UZX13829.1 hypothetical protein OGR47_10575 [Methylocystis sp. MJC1]